MRKATLFLPFCLFCLFFSCGGNLYYAEEYAFDCSTQQLLDAIDSLKALYPQHNVMYNMNGADSLVNADDKVDPNGNFTYRYFKVVKDGDTIFFATKIHTRYINDTISKYDIMHDAWAARRYYGSLYFNVVYIGKPFSHGKSINTKDLSREENKYYIKLFEDSIVNKIKIRRFNTFL